MFTLSVGTLKLFKAIASILLMLAGIASGTARAADPVVTGTVSLAVPCFLSGEPTARADDLIHQGRRFDCQRSGREGDDPTIWVRFDVSSQAIDARRQWSFQHGVTQAADERVWALYSDGVILASPTGREEARRILGGPTQRFTLPSRDGRIIALLARADALENRRGPVPRAKLMDAADDAAMQATINVVFGAMAGVLLGILLYNFTLFAVLRHKVLAAFCWPIVGNLFYGLIWSNLILWFFPSMSTATQFGWNALAICCCFVATAAYFRAFIEPGMTKDWSNTWQMRIGMLTIALSVLRLLPPVHAIGWQVLDALLYSALLGMTALLIHDCATALLRGSRAVRFFLFAWSLPIIIAISRIFWGLGSIRTESALFDATSFVAMSVQAILSAVALSWRFRQIQDERDEAQMLAQTDSLTGLLNRRAFLKAVEEGNHVKRLVLLDIDDFKAINDRFGHDVGDQAIATVARIMRNFSSDEALIGRLGGEEFAVVIPDGSDPHLEDRLRRVVARAQILPDGGHVTISAGVSCGLVDNADAWRQLYIAADAALYDAKRSGRNRIHHAATAFAA